MVVKKGKVVYIPPVVIDELEDIKREDEIHTGSEAFKKMVKYARVGREVKRMATLDFSRAVSRPSLDLFGNKKKKKRGWL